MRRKLKIDQTTAREFLYLPLYQGGLGIPNLELMTDIIALKSIQKLSCHNFKLLQLSVNLAVEKTSNSTKTRNLNIFENFHRIANKYKLKVDTCYYEETKFQDNDFKKHNKCKNFNIWTGGSTGGSKSDAR